MAKSILVTGGTKGIGKAIINKFIEEGFDIFTCSRNLQDLVKLKNELNIRFPEREVFIQAADLSRKEDVLDYAKSVKAICVPDILVNNAGLFLPGSIYNEDEGNFELTLQTNLFSVYYLTRAFTQGMMERKGGHIFSMGSIAGITSYANGGSYAISKWALLGFTKCLRQELKNFNIKVTSILPGATFTPSWEGSGIPEERFMKAEDVAECVWSAYNLSPTSVVEEIVIRPQLGDL